MNSAAPTDLKALLADPAVSRWYRDLNQRADARAGENRRWIVQLTDLTRRLADSAGAESPERWLEVALFYVRLYAAVEELPDRLAFGRELRERAQDALLLNAPLSQRDVLGRFLFLRAEQLRCSIALRDGLTPDERVVVWLIRNYNCHISVDGDGLKLKKSGEISELREVAGRTLSIAQIDEIRNAMARRYANEFEGAKEIAKKLLVHVEALFEAFEALHAYETVSVDQTPE